MASYEQNKSSKLWSVRFRIIENGKEHQKRLSGFRTKKEAQNGYIEFLKEQEKKKIELSPKGITFDILIEQYLKWQESRIKESSLYEIEKNIEKHIKPYFTNKIVSQTTPKDILQWQETINSYSYKYKCKLRNWLSAIYKYGEKYYDLNNIMSKVDTFRKTEQKKEMSFWTKTEFEQFISSVNDLQYNTLFKTLYITGCRKGELLALNWNDIDFEKKTIKINKSITRKSKKSTWKVTTPKNQSSNRTIDIPETLCKQLDEYKKSQNKISNFIFGCDRPIAERTLDREFEKYCTKANVKKIRIHDFRHSCASLLISEGVSIVAVSKRLGHKNIEQTLNTYSHMMPNDVAKIIEILNDI